MDDELTPADVIQLTHELEESLWSKSVGNTQPENARVVRLLAQVSEHASQGTLTEQENKFLFKALRYFLSSYRPEVADGRELSRAFGLVASKGNPESSDERNSYILVEILEHLMSNKKHTLGDAFVSVSLNLEFREFIKESFGRELPGESGIKKVWENSTEQQREFAFSLIRLKLGREITQEKLDRLAKFVGSLRARHPRLFPVSPRK